MKKILVLLTFLGIIFLVKPESAQACSCLPPAPPLESLEKSTAVFAGRVTSITNPILDQATSLQATLRVSEVWKGAETPIIEITTAGNSAMCGFSFEEGKEYLVYATESEGALQASLCSRTALLSQAGDDLQALGEGRKVRIAIDENSQDGEQTNRIIWMISTVVITVVVGGVIVVIAKKKENKS